MIEAGQDCDECCVELSLVPLVRGQAWTTEYGIPTQRRGTYFTGAWPVRASLTAHV